MCGESGMKLSFLTAFFSLLLCNAAPSAYSDTYTCDVKGAVRCLCPASLLVSCKSSDGVTINASVDDAQKALTISYTCGTVTGTLTKPASEIRQYYGGDDAFKSDAKAHGQTVSADTYCTFSFTADSDALKLYKDPEETNKIDLGGCAWVSSQAGGLFATQSEGGLFSVGSSCAPTFPVQTGVCAGEISCKGKKREIRACESSGNSACPTATECYNQGTRTGNPNKFKATTLSPTNPAAKGFRAARLQFSRQRMVKVACAWLA
jgi:hypothetical protein